VPNNFFSTPRLVSSQSLLIAKLKPD